MRKLFSAIVAISAIIACSSNTVIVTSHDADITITDDSSAPDSSVCNKPCGGSCCSTTSETCIANTCCRNSEVCGASCGCGAGSCINNACCAPTNICGTSCCSANEACFDDGKGTKKCVKDCTASSQCNTSIGECCSGLDANGRCSNAGTTWGCIPYGGTCTGLQICRCSVGADCTSGSCAPHVDPNTLQPIGPYVCKANDGGRYNGCNGLTTCSNNLCCVTDGIANKFCASPCINDTQCGGAKCNPYNFSSSSCSGPNACGP